MLRKINWNKGSGAIIYGSFLVLAGIMLMYLTIERNHAYHAAVYSQTRTDAIADGAAEYGQRVYGMSVNDVNQMASKINNYNNNLYDKDMTINIDQKKLTEKNDIKVTSKTSMNTLFTDEEVTVKRDATTHAITDLDLGMDINYNAFPLNPGEIVRPYYNSYKGYRNTAIINDIIGQFKLMVHPRYVSPQGDSSRSQILLWDYTVAMGCQIPVKSTTGDTLTASEVCEWMQSGEGKSAGWKKVSAKKAQDAANKGCPAVLIEYEKDKNGTAFIIRNDSATYSDSRGVLVACAGVTRTESSYANQYLDDKLEHFYFIHE